MMTAGWRLAPSNLKTGFLPHGAMKKKPVW
jgi:hypothetical protein